MTKYLIEVMPDCWRSSHRAAGNWGVYPLNGAERRIVDESELPSDDAEYDCVLRVATAADIARYGDDEPEPDYPPDSQRTRDADHYLEQWKEDKLREKEDW